VKKVGDEAGLRAAEVVRPCRDCGRPASPGHTYCPECLDKGAERMRRLRRTRREKNLCEQCGAEVAPENRLCGKCLRRAADWSQRFRMRRREAGLCVICGEPVEPQPDGSLPPLCRQHDHKARERRAEVYWDRRSQGLCVTCGLPVEKGESSGPLFARCERCRKRLNESKLRGKLGLPQIKRRFAQRK
jgi:predicted amidophosphoribosyltransferase